jgi:hypothetical protein
MRRLIWVGIAYAMLTAVMMSAQAQTTKPAPKAPAAARVPASTTANEEIIKLAKAGMSDEIILTVVAKNKTGFDTSVDALLKLKEAGVSQKVIAAMLGGPPVTAAPTTAPIVSSAPVAPAPGPPATSLAAAPKVGADDASLPPPIGSDATTRFHFTLFISAPQRDGFFDTSKDIQDSIKDIREKIAKEKSVVLTLIDDRSKADIILTIVERGIGSMAYGQRTELQDYYGGASLEQAPLVASTYWVSSMLQVGGYKKEFTGHQSQDQTFSRLTFGAWGKCGSQIATNVVSWAATNAALISRYKTAAVKSN